MQISTNAARRICVTVTQVAATRTVPTHALVIKGTQEMERVVQVTAVTHAGGTLL